jgi:hypothetical protein
MDNWQLSLVSILSVNCCSCPGGFILPDSCIFATHYIASSPDDTFDHDVENYESLCLGLWYCNQWSHKEWIAKFYIMTNFYPAPHSFLNGVSVFMA